MDFLKQEVKEVALFAVLINSDETRLAEPLRKALEMYETNLTTNFWKNVAIVFTRWGNSHADIIKRKRTGIPKEMKIKEFKKFVKNKFPKSDPE